MRNGAGDPCTETHLRVIAAHCARHFLKQQQQQQREIDLNRLISNGGAKPGPILNLPVSDGYNHVRKLVGGSPASRKIRDTWDTAVSAMANEKEL